MHHPDQKPCNETKYIKKDITKHLIKAKRLNDINGAPLVITMIPMFSKDTPFPVPFKCLQFLVFGAYYL